MKAPSFLSRFSARRAHASRRARIRTRWLASVEPLEGRLVLSTFTWNSQTSGDFNNPAMWTGPGGINAVPGPGDNAVLPQGDYTVTVTGSATVNSLNASGGTSFDVASGTFDVTNAIALPNSTITNLTVAAGATFTTSAETTTLGSSALISGNLNVAAGATLDFNNNGNGANLEAGATLTGAGTFDVTSGVMVDAPITAPTNLLFDAGDSDGIDGTGTLTVPSGATLDFRSGYMEGVGGATDISSGANLILDGTSSKFIEDRAFNDAGTTTWTGAGPLEIDGQAVFTNSGTFAIQNDTPLSGTGIFDNTGTLTKTSPSGVGTTDITATYDNSGNTIGQSGVLQLDNGGINTGKLDIPGSSGTIDITGRNYNLNPGTTVIGTGTLHLTSGFDGGTLVNLNTDLTVSNLSIDDGTLTGTGSLTVPGTLSMATATISTTGLLNLPTGSTLTMFGASQTSTFSDVTVNEMGTATLSGTEAFALANSATFNNAGTFTLQNDTIGSYGGLDLGGATFINTGTLIKTSPSGPTGLTDISNGIFLNSGTVSVVSGQILLDVTGTDTGHLDASSGATLLLSRTWNLNAGSSFNGAGSFGIGDGFFGYGTINVNASITAPDFTITGGNVIVSPSASTFTVTTLNFPAGQITGPGTVVIPANGTVAFTSSSSKTLSSGTLSISGVANWSGTGSINLGSGAVINVLASGTFNDSNDEAINGGSTEAIDVSGKFIKTSLTGVGTTTIGSKTNILPGGSIILSSGNLSTGSLINVGTISLASQTVLNVDGTYIQPNAGTLDVAVGGAPATALFGQLKATSTGSVNGTLNATLANNFVPAVGQIFPVMTFSSLTGNFTTFNPPRNGTNPLLYTSLTSSAVDLLVNPPVPPPSAPTGLAIYPPDDTGGPGTTSNHLPRFTGQATPGILVQIYNQNQKMVAAGFAAQNGTFILTPLAPLATGSYTFIAVGISSTGVYSADSTPLKVTITPPAAPTGLAILSSEVTGGPGVTAFHEPTITGQATPGIAVQIYQNGHFVAAAVANASGTFTATATTALSPGTYPMIAVAVDQYGNYGTLSAPLSVTITPPPAAPTGLTIYPADDNDGSNKTTLTQPRLTGTAQAGLLVQIYDSLGNYIGGAIANSAGTFLITPVAKLSVGIHLLKAVSIDAGGNYGAISSTYSLTIA